jgi:hypothetical protein
MQQAFNIAKKKKHPDLANIFESLADLYLQKSKQAEETQQAGYKKQSIDYLIKALKITETHLSKNKFQMTRIQGKIVNTQ